MFKCNDKGADGVFRLLFGAIKVPKLAKLIKEIFICMLCLLTPTQKVGLVSHHQTSHVDMIFSDLSLSLSLSLSLYIYIYILNDKKAY